MRGDNQDSTSLDLLLDAICNTFGGIVFLAILLSLMLMGKTAKQKSLADSPPAALSAEEIRQLVDQLDSLATEHELLAVATAGLPSRRQFEDGGKLQSLAADVQQAEHVYRALLSENTELALELANQLTANAELAAENASLANEVESAATAVDAMQELLQSAVDLASTNVTLPRTRTRYGSRPILLLKEGELFVAHRTGQGRAGFNTKQVTIRDRGDAILVSPIPGLGIPASTRADVPAIANLLDELTGVRSRAVTLAIWPDSYHYFSMIQELLITRDIFYEQWVQGEGEVLELYFGSHGGAFQ